MTCLVSGQRKIALLNSKKSAFHVTISFPPFHSMAKLFNHQHLKDMCPKKGQDDFHSEKNKKKEKKL
jgi:hypothetical protein